MSTTVLSLSAVVFLSVAADHALAAPAPHNPLDVWHWRQPLPQGNTLNKVAFGTDVFVVAGQNGTILTSSEGVNWIIRNSTTTADLSSVRRLDGRFIAVGAQGAIITSLDGIAWALRNSGASGELRDVAWGNGRFVAVGLNAQTVTSIDATNWTPRNLGLGTSLYGVTFGAGLFVAVGFDGEILSSPDGANWQTQNSGLNQSLVDVIYERGLFVALGEYGRLTTSVDGIVWTEADQTSFARMSSIAYGLGRFVAVGDVGDSMTSNDGVSWRLRRSTPDGLRGLAIGNETFVAVGEYGVILNSRDGLNWTVRSSGTPQQYFYNYYQAVASDQNRLVAASSFNIVTSEDGVNWIHDASPGYFPTFDLTYGNGRFVIVGGNGSLVSSNGRQWTGAIVPLGVPRGLAHGAGLFVTVGEGDAISTSTDGLLWTSHGLGTNYILAGVAHGNGRFVAIGPTHSGWSSDGTNWTFRTLSGEPGLSGGIAFGNGVFAATTESGVIATSTDSLHWRQQPVASSGAINIAYGPGGFVAVGWFGTILSSPDGTNWQRRAFGMGEVLNDVVAFKNSFVTVGSRVILQSDPISNSAPAIAVAPANQTTPETFAASFNVIATGSSPLSYQWLKEGVAVPGGTNSYLAFVRAQFTDEGNYAVVISNNFGAVTSAVVSLTVEPLMAPTIVQPPASQTIDEFTSASFSVVAAGTPPLYYQWLKDDLEIDFASETNYTTFAGDASVEGFYSVVVSNFVGSVTSPPAALIVRPQPPWIFDQPDNQIARPGGSAFFQVRASSGFPLTYQWLKDGAPISDATNDVLNLAGVQVTDAGFYSVVVSTRASSSTSAVARLIVEVSDTLDRWSVRPLAIVSALNAISYGQGLFVTVGDLGTILHSTNGHEWHAQSVGPEAALKGVSHGRGGFIAVGADEVRTQSVIYASADGVSWAVVTTIDNTLLRAVTYGAGLWVAVGAVESDAVVFTSPDGLRWTKQTDRFFGALHAVTYAQGVFVITGQSGRLLTSDDGVRWTYHFETGFDLDGISFGAGSFAAVGDLGYVLRSTNGSSWEMILTGSQAFLHGITFGDGNFVAVGAAGVVVSSYDGIAWLARDSSLIENLHGVAYGNGTFIVVGEAGLIAQSEPLPNTPPLVIDQPRARDVLAGSTVSFGVTASGGHPLFYQWLKDGVSIDGATNATFELFGVEPSNAGDYRVRVSNALGSALSQTARLTVDPRVKSLNWVARNPVPPPNRLRAIIYENGVFVATGEGGTIVTSPDGTNWTQRVSGTRAFLTAVTYGNGRFVAMGTILAPFGGPLAFGGFVTSLDGTNWTAHLGPPVPSLNDLCFGNGRFVAVGENGTLVTSEDGVSWVRQTTGTNSSLYHVAFGNGLFVAIGSPDVALTSTNGRDWSLHEPGVVEFVSGLAFGNGYFVATAGNYPWRVYSSTNGINWSLQSANEASVSGLRFDNGLFLATTYGAVWSSPDATNWTRHPIQIAPDVQDLAYGSGLFVSVDGAGTIMTSPDLSRWTVQNRGPRTPLRSVTFGNGLHVAAGGDTAFGGVFTNNILTSPEGVVWTNFVTAPGVYFQGVAFGNQTYVGVGYTLDPSGNRVVGVALFSPDGVNWNFADPGTEELLNSVSFAQGQFAAVGSRGTILFSPDGRSWNLRHQTESLSLHGITYGNGRWVAVGGAGLFLPLPKILVSSNGFDWSDQGVSLPASRFGNMLLRGVAYGPGLFVAVGQIACFRFCAPLGELWTSPDGFNWTRRTSENLPSLYAVTYGNNAFVGVGFAGTVVTSVRGLNWTRQDFAASASLLAVTAARGRFVAVGTSGLIIQSDLIAPSSPPLARARLVSPISFLSSSNNFVFISGNGSNAAVLLDGSLSSDPENDPLQFAWLKDGEAMPFATGAFASALLAVGPHAITLRVDDGTGSDTDTLDVEVVTAADAVEALEQLVEQSSLPSRDKRKLLKILRDARAEFACASFKRGIKELHAFKKKVRKVARENPALAAALRSAAQEIIDAVRPPGSRHFRITGVQRQADASVLLEFVAPDGPDYAVECSADMVHWRLLGLATPRSEEVYEFEDRDPPAACRFYRVVEY